MLTPEREQRLTQLSLADALKDPEFERCTFAEVIVGKLASTPPEDVGDLITSGNGYESSVEKHATDILCLVDERWGDDNDESDNYDECQERVIAALTFVIALTCYFSDEDILQKQCVCIANRIADVWNYDMLKKGIRIMQERYGAAISTYDILNPKQEIPKRMLNKPDHFRRYLQYNRCKVNTDTATKWVIKNRDQPDFWREYKKLDLCFADYLACSTKGFSPLPTLGDIKYVGTHPNDDDDDDETYAKALINIIAHNEKHAFWYFTLLYKFDTTKISEEVLRAVDIGRWNHGSDYCDIFAQINCEPKTCAEVILDMALKCETQEELESLNCIMRTANGAEFDSGGLTAAHCSHWFCYPLLVMARSQGKPIAGELDRLKAWFARTFKAYPSRYENMLEMCDTYRLPIYGFWTNSMWDLMLFPNINQDYCSEALINLVRRYELCPFSVLKELFRDTPRTCDRSALMEALWDENPSEAAYILKQNPMDIGVQLARKIDVPWLVDSITNLDELVDDEDMADKRMHDAAVRFLDK
jgi:hypothetical protein